MKDNGLAEAIIKLILKIRQVTFNKTPETVKPQRFVSKSCSSNKERWNSDINTIYYVCTVS